MFFCVFSSFLYFISSVSVFILILLQSYCLLSFVALCFIPLLFTALSYIAPSHSLFLGVYPSLSFFFGLFLLVSFCLYSPSFYSVLSSLSVCSSTPPPSRRTILYCSFYSTSFELLTDLLFHTLSLVTHSCAPHLSLVSFCLLLPLYFFPFFFFLSSLIVASSITSSFSDSLSFALSSIALVTLVLT